MTAIKDPVVSPRQPIRAVPALHIWISATVIAAVAVTALDALLLQEKKSFFTGGFLAATHAATVTQVVSFLATSLIVDASCLGLATALWLALTSRLRLTWPARLLLATLGSLVPVVVANLIGYSLLAYLGDAFDLSLMFDLTGRSPREVLAVASSHLFTPMLLFVGLLAIVCSIVWVVNRRSIIARRVRTVISGRMLAHAGALWLAGFFTFTAASTLDDLFEDGLRRKPSGQVYTWLASKLTDFDGDGFGVVGRTRDPAPFSAAIYPFALDVPGNGIDENGVGGDLPAGGPGYGENAPAAVSCGRGPDILFVVLESFRADTIGRSVRGQPVTPVLESIARDGVSSLRAYSHNGYTTHSRFHLFTGSLVGLRRDGSLVDDFKALGYEVAYFSAQDESFGGESLGVGFDRADVSYDARHDRDRRYTTFTTAGSLAVSHRTLQGRIEDFLAARKDDRPLFLYVNFHDTHFPYHHAEIEPILTTQFVTQARINPSRAAAVQEMYDNAAANVDRALGATLKAATRTLGGPPAVIVTADHGESLFDEGFLGHGYALNDVQTRIPLIVRGLPVEIREPFGQTDLRNAMVASVSRDPEEQPRIVHDSEKAVFQYLGNIDRPRQIGFIDDEGRIVYDFRDRRVQLPGGTRERPDRLTRKDAAKLERLIHFWERMMLARFPTVTTEINRAPGGS